MAHDVRDLPAGRSDGLNRFLGGSPLAVAFRLVLLSILVGVVLAAIGFDPWNILDQHSSAVPATVGSRLRCRELAVALLPARRCHRDPDLAAVTRVRLAAALRLPEMRGRRKHAMPAARVHSAQWSDTRN